MSTLQECEPRPFRLPPSDDQSFRRRASSAQGPLAGAGPSAKNSAKIVVVGAGFAGLETVRALHRANVQVTLIDKKNHHCFQPLLYQVATAALSPADIAWPIRSIVSNQTNALVIMGEVCAVDTAAKIVTTKDGDQVVFDFLVIATGSSSSYFNHPEWSEHAPGLKTVEDATKIRAKILIGFEKAEKARLASDIKKFMTFVIVGGGPTGVELAGSIAEISRNVLARDFRRIDPQSARVVLIEAGPRILPSFPAELSDYTKRALADVNVEVMMGSAVTTCDADGVSLSDGRRIQSSCVLWAAGVQASPAAEWLKVRGDRAGRVGVNEFLQLEDAPNVFVIGDTASVCSGGETVPGLAPAAKQMGNYVGKQIAHLVSGRPSPIRPFRYRHQGDLATVGRKVAVVAFGRTKLKGFLGWLVWSMAHIYFLIGARNRAVVAINWLWEYLTFQRGARLIS
jgi:NADH:quinone reductase (non-electrogenic)